MTGVDFSPVGLAKAKRFADLRGVEVTWVESAVENWTPPPDGFDLVAMLYLQLPQPARSAALAVAASAVAPGGTLLVIAHDLDNLTRGYGGPPVPDVLYQVGDVTEAAVDAGLTVVRAEQAVRVVDTDDAPRGAIDTVVRADAIAIAPSAFWTGGTPGEPGRDPPLECPQFVVAVTDCPSPPAAPGLFPLPGSKESPPAPVA